MFRKSALVLAAPLLLATACAKEADQGALEVRTGAEAVSALQAAPDAAADAGTAKFEMVMEMTVMDQAVEVVANGGYDSDAGQMSMTMDMGTLFEQMAEAEGEPLPEGFGGPWEMVADGDTVYLRMPILSMLTGTDGWVSMSASDLGASAELGLGAGTYDPSKMLETLRGVGGEPEVVGEEAVRGVDTTHYRVEVDLAEALAQVPESQRASVEASLEQLGDVGDGTMPIDVWIDADGLPRRLQMDMASAMAQLSDDELSMTMTMDFFGYGDDVAIEVPSPDEVTSFSEVMGDFGAGLGS
jgi:hypothetical protein